MLKFLANFGSEFSDKRVNHTNDMKELTLAL